MRREETYWSSSHPPLTCAVLSCPLFLIFPALLPVEYFRKGMDGWTGTGTGTGAPFRFRFPTSWRCSPAPCLTVRKHGGNIMADQPTDRSWTCAHCFRLSIIPLWRTENKRNKKPVQYKAYHHHAFSARAIAAGFRSHAKRIEEQKKQNDKKKQQQQLSLSYCAAPVVVVVVILASVVTSINCLQEPGRRRPRRRRCLQLFALRFSF